MQRRRWLQSTLAATLGHGLVLPSSWASSADGLNASSAPHVYAPVTRGTVLNFPKDHGAHPNHRIEWWYATGWLKTESGRELGFQVTFFRVRTSLGHASPLMQSRFAPVQFYFAHAAVSDPAIGRVVHEERSARGALDLAGASETDTQVWLRDWRFTRKGGVYFAAIAAKDFSLHLNLVPTQPLLLQGEQGFSRKGPAETQASHYYSQPHLKVEGEVRVNGRRENTAGSAWLDHEWSSELMPPGATGWDWAGLNLDDGSALMAFRMRSAGDKDVWRAAKLRDSAGNTQTYAMDEIALTPLRRWTSPNNKARYPVAMDVRVGKRVFRLQPVFDDQELISKGAGTGNTYWEGAVRVQELVAGSAKPAGRGYLELTGYAGKMNL